MPLYPQSILKKPTDFPPVPFNLDEKVIEDDNESLDIVLPKSDLNDFADFDRPTAKPGMKCHYQLFHNKLKIVSSCSYMGRRFILPFKSKSKLVG